MGGGWTFYIKRELEGKKPCGRGEVCLRQKLGKNLWEGRSTSSRDPRRGSKGKENQRGGTRRKSIDCRTNQEAGPLLEECAARLLSERWKNGRGGLKKKGGGPPM